MITKPTVIMVPGFMCDARLFAHQVDALGKDLYLHVETPQATATSMTEMAQDLLRKAPDEFALLGLSMGAIVAMEVMKLAPERVTKLALFDCSPFGDVPENSVERRKQIELVRAGQLRDIMETRHIPKYFDPERHDPVLESLCVDMAESIGATAFENHQTALINRPDQSNDLHKIKVPTLIAFGSNDRLCPPKNHEYIHSLIDHSELRSIAGAGHLPTIESATECTGLIQKWFLT